MSTWIEQFADELAAQRYTPLTIEGYTASARHFAAWLGCAGISIDLIDDAMSFVGLPNIGVGVLVGGSGCVSHQNILAAPGGSLFSCKRKVSHVHP
ncbi:hypothetical protein Q1M62_02315 (plasmid) [Sinorhizobium meliloti]|nr:hypothetical protein LZK74_02330 [Sinorhizobium meliloti]WKL28470.1 hypothetical protein Q1M65_02355 [Sinorhizobium meliloti]WKL34028.1 hypothetical protein Q1M62_02315 [Sinorhizobium meliloti]